MATSWYRRLFIWLYFFPFSMLSQEETLPNRKLFNSFSSAELHYLASIYNWDSGTTTLQWIIESPKCDLGTAIMIFWLAEPDYYFRYQSIPEDEFDADVWKLLQSILENIRSEKFLTVEQSFVPTEAGYQVNHVEARGVWELPTVLQSGF